MKKITPDMSVDNLFGISETRKKLLEKLNIHTIDDLVRHYPRLYEDRSIITKVADARLNSVASLELEISSVLTDRRIISKKAHGRAMTIQKVFAKDETGVVELTFFNQSFLKNTLLFGRRFRFTGKITGNFTKTEMISPVYEPIKESSDLPLFVPVYRRTAGISSKLLSSAVKSALEIYKENGYESLTDEIMQEYSLVPLYFALENIHFPKNESDLEKARKRLCFEELLDFQIKLMLLGKKERRGKSFFVESESVGKFISSLPYTLTCGQKRCVEDILNDMSGKTAKNEDGSIPPCRRLVQGDVGSGKTVVAACCMYAVYSAGYQSAIMAPTELLAEQHYKSLKNMFAFCNANIRLLTGSTSTREKKEIISLLREGKIDILVGTHAILEENVEFSSLALVITDEQHRFGVRQREKLAAKQNTTDKSGIFKPHTVVMSATPIPRTLAMMLYGDLDISVIDTLPAGRKKISTYAVGENMRERIYNFIRKTVDAGHQVYIVCPLVESVSYDEDNLPYISDDDEKSAIDHAKHLQNDIFPNLRIGTLYGKMKGAQKDKVMKEFAAGELDILVSTTVIEVGIDVPNATLIVIENAERFGLTQLHQLRGRVGRGKDESFCVLISDLTKSKDSTAKARFDVLCKNESGFAISQKDLELRGPGEFFGTSQHGELNFKIANIADVETVEKTRALAAKIVANMK